RVSHERSDVAALLPLLSPGERARADAYAAPRDRERFVISRGRLRTILADYLSCTAASVPLTIDACGKPSHPEVRFNVAHADDVVLFVCASRSVGVDVEWLGRRFDPRRLSARCLTPRERDAWERLNATDRCAAFLRLWVRKEACVKASG